MENVGDCSTSVEYGRRRKALGYTHSRAFSNMFTFLDFCKRNSLDKSNSLTYWSEQTQTMFISY